MHYGTLILAKIGPRGDRRLVAIGPALHKVGHLEKGVEPEQGWATVKFAEQLAAEHRTKFLNPQYVETEVPVTRQAIPTPTYSGLASILGPYPQTSVPITVTRIEKKRDLTGYSVRWKMIENLMSR